MGRRMRSTSTAIAVFTFTFVCGLSACDFDSRPTATMTRGDAVQRCDAAMCPAERGGAGRRAGGSGEGAARAPGDRDASAPAAEQDAAAPGGCERARCGVADGCCPDACGAERDRDCKVRCGDGRVEGAERCDGDAQCGGDCLPLLDAALVHRYAFAGDGERAVDAVGHADGEIVGAELRGTGRLSLRGGDRSDPPHVQLPRGLLSALTSATIEVWLQWRGGGEWQRVFDFGNHGRDEQGEQQGTRFWYVTPRDDEGRILTQMNFTDAPWDPENDFSVAGSEPLSSGELHQVVTSFDDGTRTLRLYVDGRELGATPGVRGRLSQIDDRQLFIGRSQYENDPGLSATVEELRVYDRALSAEAIARSFELGPDPRPAKTP